MLHFRLKYIIIIIITIITIIIKKFQTVKEYTLLL